MAEDTVWIALLRGINVGGKHLLPMARLRDLAAAIGLREPRTYVQSGNLVFHGRGRAADHERRLQAAMAAACGFPVPVVVRAAAEFAGWATAPAFADAAAARPAALHVALVSGKWPPAAVAQLVAAAKAGERVELSNGALWIDFVGGVARSKLTSAVLDRVAGTTVTLRNFRTVVALAELAGAG